MDGEAGNGRVSSRAQALRRYLPALPILAWARSYDRDTLVSDLLAALIVTIIALGVLWGVVIPGITKAVSLEGPAAEAAMRKFAPAIGIVHLCMAVGLYLMLWKPA